MRRYVYRELSGAGEIRKNEDGTRYLRDLTIYDEHTIVLYGYGLFCAFRPSSVLRPKMSKVQITELACLRYPIRAA